MEKYLYSSVPSSCPYCCSYCLVISSTKYRTLEKLTIIVCQVYNFSRNLTRFRRNLLSDLVSSYVKYAEENNTDKICLVNSTFIAKNTPEKYFQTYEAQETWIENNQLRKGKFHLTSLMDGWRMRGELWMLLTTVLLGPWSSWRQVLSAASQGRLTNGPKAVQHPHWWPGQWDREQPQQIHRGYKPGRSSWYTR